MAKVIVDAAALYLASRKAKISIDYARLMNHLDEEFGVDEFVICVTYGPGSNWDSARSVMTAAKNVGWTIRDHTVTHMKPSNIAQMAAEIESAALRDKDILLMSGNGDLAPVVLRAADHYGVGVRILTDADGCSWMLKKVADDVLDLSDHISHFKKKSRERHYVGH